MSILMSMISETNKTDSLREPLQQLAMFAGESVQSFAEVQTPLRLLLPKVRDKLRDRRSLIRT
jgi:hypothetical protein